MTKEDYSRMIIRSTIEEIGYWMGRAIKDVHINPEQYSKLCEEAKKMALNFGI